MKLPVNVHADAFRAFTAWIVLVHAQNVQLTASTASTTQQYLHLTITGSGPIKVTATFMGISCKTSILTDPITVMSTPDLPFHFQSQ